MAKKKKKEFVSKVQKDVTWHKESHVKWFRIINQVGELLEDEIHKGKNNTAVTLKKGSKVIIDDLRGRVLPQYRVKDVDGKVWFVKATNVKFDFDMSDKTSDVDPIDTKYRGGIRTDNTTLATGKERYPRPAITTEDILQLKKEKNNA